VTLATKAKDDDTTVESHVYQGRAHFAVGDVIATATEFQRAIELAARPLWSLWGIAEAEYKFLRGNRSGAISQTIDLRRVALRGNYNDDLCRCNAVLARLDLLNDPAQAAQYLQDARLSADRSGHVELQLSCFHAASELHRHLGDYLQAIAESEAGILLADTCGFGVYSIDIRLSLAETYLAAGDARKALQNARSALDRSEYPDCQYAWGKADGLHFCGLAHLQLGERDLARQRLTAALALREQLGHGRIAETRVALDRLLE
jgi:tetratricopeptide (TPR) repeat protein